MHVNKKISQKICYISDKMNKHDWKTMLMMR